MGLETVRLRRYHNCGNAHLITNGFDSEVRPSPPTASGRRHFWQSCLMFGRWLLERDELPAAAERSPNRLAMQAQIRRLASNEPPPSHRHPRQFRNPLIWLASRDALPRAPARPRRHGGPISWLFSLEQLPTEPPDNNPPARFFFRWLFTLDSHERLDDHVSIKEVPPDEP